MSSDTWDAEDQAIARALDAASESETPGAPERDVDDYRAVLAHLSVDDVQPDAGLEDRIVTAALARRAPAARALDGARARRIRRMRLTTLVAATVAAAVVAGVIVTNGGSGPSAANGHISLATAKRADVDALLQAAGARTGSFGTIGRVVVDPDGNGAVYDIPHDRTLGIGLVSRGGTTVIGPAPSRGGVIEFVVDHPERVTSLTLLQAGAVIARTALTSA